ncbi:hypothetical protein BT69DRAFT_1276007, partial [Atractiella rhizophila]
MPLALRHLYNVLVRTKTEREAEHTWWAGLTDVVFPCCCIRSASPIDLPPSSSLAADWYGIREGGKLREKRARVRA